MASVAEFGYIIIPMRKFPFVLGLLVIIFQQKGISANEYSGFHVGTVSGAGFAIEDGAMESPFPMSFNLELGYDFGNQLDIIGRVGYSPLMNAINETDIKLYNFDVGIRYVPFAARFSPYFALLLGAYNSSSNTAGDSVFNSQTGFHNTDGLGLQFHLSDHHLVGFEMGTHFIINDIVNFTSLMFSGVYRYTF